MICLMLLHSLYFALLDASSLLLLGEQGGTNKVGSSPQFDTDNPLDLAQQLLVGNSLSRLNIGNLSSARLVVFGPKELTSLG